MREFACILLIRSAILLQIIVCRARFGLDRLF